MPEQSLAIENLMKVTLNIQTAEPSEVDDSGLSFVFIYGVGPTGITPFEKALYGMGIGERIKVDLTPDTFCETVGHLNLPLCKPIGTTAPVSYLVTVVDLERAQDWEVVKAMAAGGSCSDCGCGCGGH
jgi:hypothetical protein